MGRKMSLHKLSLLLREIRAPSNTWFAGPTLVHIPNGVSIGSAVLAQLTVDDVAAYRLCRVRRQCEVLVGLVPRTLVDVY